MWQYLIVWVITTVLSSLLAPKPKTTTPQPGDVDAPVAATDSPIPIDEPFIVDGEALMHPGDDAGHLEECR